MKTIDIPYERGLSEYGFVMAFVYPQEGDSLLIKGPYKQVRERAKSEARGKNALIHFSLWKDGRSRNSIRLHYDNEIVAGYVARKEGKQELLIFKNRELIFKKTYRRFPRRWFKDLEV